MFMTQLESAVAGVVTKEMKVVAVKRTYGCRGVTFPSGQQERLYSL